MLIAEKGPVVKTDTHIVNTKLITQVPSVLPQGVSSHDEISQIFPLTVCTLHGGRPAFQTAPFFTQDAVLTYNCAQLKVIFFNSVQCHVLKVRMQVFVK